jgi:hypothetical protein
MSTPRSFAEAAAFAALDAQARRSAAHLVKQRARAFALRPSELEALYPGLAVAAPDKLIAIAAHLLETARNGRQRWFGFGGEVTALNAKAALLYGRALRRATVKMGLAIHGREHVSRP